MALFTQDPTIYDSDLRPAAPLRELTDLLRYHELLALLEGEPTFINTDVVHHYLL